KSLYLPNQQDYFDYLNLLSLSTFDSSNGDELGSFQDSLSSKLTNMPEISNVSKNNVNKPEQEANSKLKTSINDIYNYCKIYK
ncbi:3491_t:CDS:2, partial [Cetraspora pellucida]